MLGEEMTLVPGQLRAFPVAQLAAAREWLATAGDRGADDKASMRVTRRRGRPPLFICAR
jgi:hypothetical protein